MFDAFNNNNNSLKHAGGSHNNNMLMSSKGSSADTVVFESWLSKGKGFKAKRRFCKLMSSMTLVYYSKEKAEAGDIKGVVSLFDASISVDQGNGSQFVISLPQDIMSGSSNSSSGNNGNAAEVVESEDDGATVDFHFKAANKTLRDQWIAELNQTIYAVAEVVIVIMLFA